MSWYPPLILVAAAALLMLLEWAGIPLGLNLRFKGDLKRESRWLAQYGQFSCTLVACLLLWRLDGRHFRRGVAPWMLAAGAMLSAAIVGTILKRLLGRVRPGHERAGAFLGPTLRHANWRESFPSQHTACAVALSAALAGLYPQAAGIFWALAIACGALRYFLDAHWPSDVLAGAALGYAVGYACVLAWI